MPDESPRTLRRYDEALETFVTAYQDYLDTGDPAARARAVAATSAASHALDALGFDVMMMPPPALGGYRVQGLYAFRAFTTSRSCTNDRPGASHRWWSTS